MSLKCAVVRIPADHDGDVMGSVADSPTKTVAIGWSTILLAAPKLRYYIFICDVNLMEKGKISWKGHKVWKNILNMF